MAGIRMISVFNLYFICDKKTVIWHMKVANIMKPMFNFRIIILNQLLNKSFGVPKKRSSGTKKISLFCGTIDWYTYLILLDIKQLETEPKICSFAKMFALNGNQTYDPRSRSRERALLLRQRVRLFIRVQGHVVL